MLYAASLGWFTVVVLPGALFWIEVKFPTMNTRFPMASMSVTRPDMIRGRFARAVEGTSVVCPGPGGGFGEETVIGADARLFALALLTASTASTVYVWVDPFTRPMSLNEVVVVVPIDAAPPSR